MTITQFGQQFDDEEISKAVTESKQRHNFWNQVAESHAYLLQSNFEQAHESAVAAKNEFQEIDINLSSFRLQRCLILSEGMLLEAEGESEYAVSHYDDSNSYDEMVTARKNMAKITTHMQNNNSKEVLKLSTAEFGEGSLITNALRAICDEDLENRRSHGTLPDKLIIRDAESNKWRLESLLSLYVATDEFEAIFRSHVQLTLNNM